MYPATTFSADSPGTWSCAWINLLIATVHLTLQLPITCLDNLTPKQDSKLHDSMSSCFISDMSPQTPLHLAWFCHSIDSVWMQPESLAKTIPTNNKDFATTTNHKNKHVHIIGKRLGQWQQVKYKPNESHTLYLVFRKCLRSSRALKQEDLVQEFFRSTTW